MSHNQTNHTIIQNPLKRSRLEEGENPSTKKSKKCFSYSNKAIAEIFKEHVVPFIYNYVEFTKLRTICKDFRDMFNQHSTKLYFPKLVNKNSGLKAIINKQNVEFLEMKFDYEEGTDLSIYEPNLFTQFTNLKNIKLIGIDDMSFFDGVFRDLPVLREIEFVNCLFGEIFWNELKEKGTLEQIIFNNCEELHEMDIINTFYSKTKLNLKFINQSAIIDNSFTEKFKEIQKEIHRRIIYKFIVMCNYTGINYNTIPIDTRNIIYKFISKNVLANIKYIDDSFFKSYE